jgi:hypothetical protein
MSNLNSILPVVVVYKTQIRKKEIYNIIVYQNIRVDDILALNKRKPYIPNEAEILEVGVGSSFEEKYRKKYKL